MGQDPILLLLRHLGGPLGEEGSALLALARGWHRVGPGTELFRQGGTAGTLFLLRRGWAKRHCNLPDGRTQVLDFVLPGEVGDVAAIMARRHDHACTTLTEAEVGVVHSEVLFAELERRPRLRALLWWLSLAQGASMRQRVVSMGSRTARERVCGLLWEIHQRLRRVGFATDRSFHLPIRQRDLADAAGLTPVHTSRTLRALETDGLVRLERDSVRIPDMAALEQEAALDDADLFLDGLPDDFPWRLFEAVHQPMQNGNTDMERADF